MGKSLFFCEGKNNSSKTKKTPDIDTSDNDFLKEPEEPTRFQTKSFGGGNQPNPMQEAKKNQPSGTQTSGEKK